MPYDLSKTLTHPTEDFSQVFAILKKALKGPMRRGSKIRVPKPETFATMTANQRAGFLTETEAFLQTKSGYYAEAKLAVIYLGLGALTAECPTKRTEFARRMNVLWSTYLRETPKCGKGKIRLWRTPRRPPPSAHAK